MTAVLAISIGDVPGFRFVLSPASTIASTINIGAKKSEHKEFKPANASYTHRKGPLPEEMLLIAVQTGVSIEDIKVGIIS